MTNTKGVEEMRSSAKGSISHLAKIDRKLLLFGLGAFTLFVLVIILFAGGKERARTELYKDATGAAGLQATISYDGKPVSGTNIYLFRDDGQQVAVVQPDKHGTMNLALPEGNYVMLIGKRLGHNKIFPEESLTLKNGKMLEIKLRY